MPLILGIISLIGTGGWIWWEASADDPVVEKDNTYLIIAVLAMLIVLFFVFKIGKTIIK